MPRPMAVTMALAVVAACSPSPTAPARPSADQLAGDGYEMVDLGDLSAFGNSIRVLKANDAGQIAGSVSNFTDFVDRSFLWDGASVRDLGSLGGNGTLVAAVNNQGQVVGSSNVATGDPHAFLWQNGAMADLGTLGGATAKATAINNRGQVVGSSQTSGGSMHAFLWENGQMRDLGTLPTGSRSAASAINQRGQVVGQSEIFSRGRMRTHAVLWDGDRLVDLGTLFYADSGNQGFDIESSGAIDINDQGAIVGSSAVPWTRFRIADRAFLWQDGVLSDLGALPGLHGSTPVRINNAGNVAGMSFFEDFSNPTAGLLWQRRDTEVVTSLDSTSHAGYWMTVTDMNQAGQIVGYGFLDRRTLHAFVSDHGVTQDLGSLGGNSFALSVNQSGDIAGWSESTSDGRHLVLWRRTSAAVTAAPGAPAAGSPPRAP